MTKISTHRALLLTMAVFAIQPLAFGAWLALIPQVKAALGLNKAEFAMALLGMPIATVPSLQIASRIMHHLGPRRLLAAGFVAQPFAILLPVAAGSQAELFGALFVMGGVTAMTQVSLNVYAGRLEKQTAATIMSRCHGFWALGLMGGSLLLILVIGLGQATALSVIAIPSAIAGVMIAFSLPKLAGEGDGTKAPPRRKLREIPHALYYISAFVLAIAMTEGAMSDWAAIYLAERLPAEATHAGIAVTIFAGFLAAGRLIGDALKVRLGVVGIARLTLGLAIAGLLMLILPLPIWFAYLGFACLGLGASVGFPLGVSAVAALDDTYEGANIAIMSSVAICGFLIGPPVIGFLAETFSLRFGLMVLLPGLIAGLWLSPALRQP